jgi:hypothetical protein
MAESKEIEAPDKHQGKPRGRRYRNVNTSGCIYGSYAGKELNTEIFDLMPEMLPFSSTICNNSSILGMVTGCTIYICIYPVTWYQQSNNTHQSS